MDRKRAQSVSDALWAIKYQEPKVAEMLRLLGLFQSGENKVSLYLSWDKIDKNGKTINITGRERKNMDVGKEVILDLIQAELADEIAKMAQLEKELEAL
jgi:hypothetical protein